MFIQILINLCQNIVYIPSINLLNFKIQIFNISFVKFVKHLCFYRHFELVASS